MNKTKRQWLILCALLLAVATAAGCGNGAAPSSGGDAGGGGAAGSADTGEKVDLTLYLWGSEGVANPDVLAAINEKMLADINASITVMYIDWGDVATKYPLLFTSGEKFDMSYASVTATISYYTLAQQDVLVDITDMLSITPDLQAEIPQETWDQVKVDGRLYGVPTLYSEFTPYGYAYRDDLREKYNLEPITSLDTMQAYLTAIAQNESFTPINGNSNDAVNLYRLFTDLTGEWISAPGIATDSLYLVATSPENYKDVIHPAFTDEFEAWCNKMKEWGDAGYWPNDILAAETGGKDNLLNGISAGFITHMPDWTGTYGSYKQSLPGIAIEWWSPAVDAGKVIGVPGVNNMTSISTTSENPERSLMAIEKFMTNEAYYRLIQYGIEGRQYELQDGMVVQPANYDQSKDGFGFAAWAFRNDRFNIPLSTEDPRRYELIEQWKKTSIDDPFGGLIFNQSNVSNEIAAVTNVNSELGRQLLFGKAQQDVSVALDAYREQLKTAGIEAIIAELKTQLESFTPINK